MKAQAVILSLALATTVFGQAVHRNFGSVVFPGGASNPSTGVTRNFGSVVFPGGMQTTPVYGSASAVGVHSGTGVVVTPPAGKGQNVIGHRPIYPNGRGSRNAGGGSYVYAYPVYVGGYDNSYATQEPAPQQPNITVVLPPQQQQATPVMIQAGPDGEYTTTMQRQPATIYEPLRRREVFDNPEPAEPTRYLLAFNDHTIYSAVAYWADGDTLHYFTKGDTHNQVSLSLIDRPLTERLNREMGIDFKLPPAK